MIRVELDAQRHAHLFAQVTVVSGVHHVLEHALVIALDALVVAQTATVGANQNVLYLVGRRARLHVHLTASVAQEIAILAVVIHV